MMKIGKMIFIKRFFILPLMLGVVMFPSMVAADNGCENEDNDAVVAALALCSTHAYNIGEIHNPKEASGKQLMDSVIAMKTTVITQQLYKQYQQLESMLARFKTQLEKAVLTSTMEAAGAKSDDSSSSTNSSGGYLPTASNCIREFASGAVAGRNCLKSNLKLVMSAAESGDLKKAIEQLKQDLKAAKSILGKKVSSSNSDEGYYVDCDGGGENDCKNHDRCNEIYGNKREKGAIIDCAAEVLGIISQAEKDEEREDRRWSSARGDRY